MSHLASNCPSAMQVQTVCSPRRRHSRVHSHLEGRPGSRSACLRIACMMPDGEAGGDLYQQRERLEQVFRQSKSLQRPAPGGLRLVCLHFVAKLHHEVPVQY